MSSGKVAGGLGREGKRNDSSAAGFETMWYSHGFTRPMNYGIIPLVISAILVLMFLFTSDSSVILKLVVVGVYALSFVFLHSPRRYPLIGMLLQVGVSVFILVYRAYEDAQRS